MQIWVWDARLVLASYSARILVPIESSPRQYGSVDAQPCTQDDLGALHGSRLRVVRDGVEFPAQLQSVMVELHARHRT